MSRHVETRQLVAAVEGVALMRGLFAGTDQDARQRLEELRAALARDAGEPVEIPIVEVDEGYARWSTTYDAPGNPLVMLEQPAVWQLLDEAPAGRTIDAACGTGRHAAHLAEQGHELTCVDRTPEMLNRARGNVAGARFVQADLCDLPLEDASFDLAVCALALEHFSDLSRPIAELGRVVRPGGRIVISESHPALRALGGAPYFVDGAGISGVVRSHPHVHADYLAAFAAARLEVRDCRELRFGIDEVRLQQPAFSLCPEATQAAFLGFPAVLIWDVAVAGGGP